MLNPFSRLEVDSWLAANSPDETKPAAELADRLKRARIATYQQAKSARPVLLTASVTLDGTTNPKTCFTEDFGRPLMIVSGSSNAPYTVRVSVRSTTDKTLWTSTPVPPISLFSNPGNTTKRYFDFPRTVPLAPREQLAITVQNPGSEAQDVTFYFWAIELTNEVLPVEDARVDRDVIAAIQNDSSGQTYILDISPAFTRTSAERVYAQSVKVELPLLVYGIAQQINPKSGVFSTDGVKLRLTDMSARYAFSNNPEQIWAWGNYFTDAEQYIYLPKPYLLRPYSQLQGEFVNSVSDPVDGTLPLFLLCRTPW